MTESALIIFVRKPEPGKVKTRLAASIGNEAALFVYQKLLLHTHAASSALSCDKYVFYAEGVEEEDMWCDGYKKMLQENLDLGGRMKAAFAQLFKKNYQRICIVGSDCFELTTEIISDAFSLLHKNDVVIGPAMDGGYYLLGMREELKDVFDGMEWSTEKVLQQTIKTMEQHRYSYALLPVLTDVDTALDLPKHILKELPRNRSEQNVQ